jgi:hypothetical protein
VYEGSFFPTSSPIIVGGSVFDDSYFNRDEVEKKCSNMITHGLNAKGRTHTRGIGNGRKPNT